MTRRIRMILNAVLGAALLLGAIACGVALNLVTQPDPGWPAIWTVLLVASLGLGAMGVICAVSALWIAIEDLVCSERETDSHGHM